MKKRGFTIVELLIVIAIIGILIAIGSISLKEQANSRGIMRVQNEVGDFFRVAAKRSQEIGERYIINFNLLEKKIKFSKNGVTTDRLNLPNIFEYEKISKTLREQNFSREMTSTGNLSKGLTLYVFKSNSKIGIQGDEIVKYAIIFKTTDKHIKFLHIRELLPINEIRENEIKPSVSGTKDTSKTTYWKTIKEQ